MIPYGRQDISEEDIAAVIAVLRSDWLTQGPTIERFERAMAEFCGAKHAIAVSSGTAALHIAAQAIGLGSDRALWTSPNTFVASANSARYCGADVDFVDIDARTYNIDAAALELKLERAAKTGKLPAAIMPVHFGGQPCAMAEIAKLARHHGIRVIEDASHAVGAEYRGTKIGACEHSDMAIFSFHPVKIMTTAEGGMVLTNDDELYRKLTLLRTHGITRDAAQMTKEPEGGWYYQQIELGFNYRITDLQAALGLSQFDRLESFLNRRREIAKRYDGALSDLPLTTPWQHPDGRSSYHLYPIRLHLAEIGMTRRDIYDGMRRAGIGVQVHYIPVHLQPYYRELGFEPGQFPEAERYYEAALSLPLYSQLTDADQDKAITALRRVLGDAGGMKLGLGTAQFGLAYGISGPGVRVNPNEIRAILDLARAHEITLLDTAPAYGYSEAVLGECLVDGDAFEIVTKTTAIGADRVTAADIARVDQAFSASLAGLRKESIYAILVHHADDLLTPGGDRLYDLLAQWRAQERVRKIGVSVYNRAQIETLLERHDYDIVQVPVSVFDQRLVADGTLDLLKRANVEVHARSVLLQGLALMEPSTFPASLQPARSLVDRFRSTMSDWGVSPLAGALRYVASLAAIDKVVVGVHSAAQLEECLRALEAPGANRDYSYFSCTDEAIIDPRQWRTG